MPTLDRRPNSAQHIIAWADLVAVPWLNGGGVTRQIISRALTASDDEVSGDWDWRLSIADVGSAGAFSDFTGMTRILTVIEGVSITLTVDGVEEQLDRFRPFRFDGGADTSAQLPHGPIRDLNLIARTDRANGDVRIEMLSSDHPRHVGKGSVCVLLAGHSQLHTGSDTGADKGADKESDTAAKPGISAHTRTTALQRFDTVVGTSTTQLSLHGDATIAVITVHPATKSTTSESSSTRRFRTTR